MTIQNRGEIRDLLAHAKVIAVVGHSDKPHRTSYRIAQYLRNAGYKVYAVNPTVAEIDGEPAYPDLASIPEPIDIVDVFRRAEFLQSIVDEAITVGAKAVWGQLGVVDQDAGKRAYLPINEWTWGRQENGIFLAQIAYSSKGFRSLYNERTDALVQELSSTLDEARQQQLLAEIEAEVFQHHWVVPLYDASAVYGYSDRVLEHPMPAYGAHFLDLHRIVVRD